MKLEGMRRVVFRTSVLIVSCTLLLTASFIGSIAAVSGDIYGFEARVPWYLVTAAGVFVATIVLLEINEAIGRTIIVTAIFTGVVSFFLISLAVEGVIFTLNNPATVFVSQLILYFFAAALIATGIGYWGLRHWREFTANQRESL
jgi:FlaA1/EpsC-like NDP-sugar epimerase